MELAREKDAQVVSEATINEVKDYVAQTFEPYVVCPNESLKMPAIEVLDVSHLVPSDLEQQIESWRKIHERLDPRMMHGYHELMEQINKMSMSFSSLNQKDSKVEEPTDNNEDKSTGEEGEETPKEKDE